MNWLAFALCGPLLWAISTHLDKYLVERYFRNADVVVLTLFTALMGLILMPIIAWFDPAVFQRDWTSIALMAVSGILYMGAIIFYLNALQGHEASVVAPFFQSSPLFGYTLAYFILGETLSGTQMLGGLLIWGLQPGPLLFVEQKDFVWGLIASMYLGNIVGLIVVLTCVPLFAAILRVPFSIIAPVIIVICAIGAYTVHNSMFDVWLMLFFGVLGYLFKKLDYPLAPLVLALVLGDRAEENFRNSMKMSQGDMGIFFSGTLVGSLCSLIPGTGPTIASFVA